MSVHPQARVVRRREYRESAWRNGGGVTFEIAREPAHTEEFSWRLSLARVDRDGPFSDFTGYRRAVTLVEGGGCRLHVKGSIRQLRDPGDTLFFPGDAAVNCELIKGPCSDLNLMVRTPGQIVSVEHFSLLPNDPESLRGDCWASVFCLHGAVDCLRLASGERLTLETFDTLLAPPAEAAQWRLLRGPQDARVVVHAWRPG